MTSHSIQIEVPAGKVQQILEQLQTAQDTIYQCYSELERLGVLVIRETVTDNDR